MTHVESPWEAHQRCRWTRTNARLFMRPDADRYQRPEYRSRHQLPDYGQKYDPSQPRVPAGNSDGGQWTGGNGSSGLTDVSSSRRRLPGSIFVNGRWLEATPAQQARFEAANARAQEAMRRLREREPDWRPQPGAYGTGIESEIRRADDLAAEAQARISYLQSVGIGPGPFAGESIPARGPERNFTAAERREVNRIGSKTGCHTCGTVEAGALSGNYIADHQPPNALNTLGRTQRLFPHCATCSSIQGGWLSYYGGRRIK